MKNDRKTRMNLSSEAIHERLLVHTGGAVARPLPHEVVGISTDLLGSGWDRGVPLPRSLLPLNALRHPTEGSASGWYIWAGEELSDAADFFAPVHVSHVIDHCPGIVPYLLLPAGWRVLIAPDYEDVWFDQGLIDAVSGETPSPL